MAAPYGNRELGLDVNLYNIVTITIFLKTLNITFMIHLYSFIMIHDKKDSRFIISN